IATALGTALDQLVAMREKEGAHLARDLAGRLQLLRDAAARIRGRAPLVAESYRRQLQERIAQAGINLAPDDHERLLKEVAFFADRSDITEELTRLESHFAQFE